MRRLWLWIPLMVAFVALIGFNLTLTPETPTTGTGVGKLSPQDATPSASSQAPAREPPSVLAADLNAPGGTVGQDLIIVDSVFEAFRTNFPGVGNPVGENSEITAALTGRNSLNLQLIPRRHPAISPRGELIDRWGTPFFFHQLGGDVMEIRSAGPDRIMHTEDDAVLAPGG